MANLVGPHTHLVFGVILIVFFAASSLTAQEPISTLRGGHRDEIYAIAFSPDGKILASAGKGGTVRLWDLSTSKEIRVFAGHLGYVFCLDFSPDGKTLSVGGGKPGKTIYDIELSGTTVTKVPSVGEIKLWEVSSGKELGTAEFESCTIKGIVFAKRKDVLISARSDGKADWLQTPTMRIVKNVENPLGENGAVVVSREGSAVFLAPERGGVRILDKKNDKAWFCAQPGEITSLATTSDGRLVACGTTEIRVWNPHTGKSEGNLMGYKAGVFALAFSPSGKIIASGSGAAYRQLNFHAGEIKFWSASAKKELATIVSHKGIVSCLAFSPDGKMLASGSVDSTVKLWRVPELD